MDRTEPSRLTRRRLLELGGLATVGAGLGLPVAASGAAPSEAPAWLKRSSYTSAIGDRFSIRTADAVIATRLEAVADLLGSSPSGRPLAGRDDAFALILSGPASSAIPQGSYRVRNAEIGAFRALVVPGSRDGRVQRYAIVVNRAG